MNVYSITRSPDANRVEPYHKDQTNETILPRALINVKPEFSINATIKEMNNNNNNNSLLMNNNNLNNNNKSPLHQKLSPSYPPYHHSSAMNSATMLMHHQQQQQQQQQNGARDSSSSRGTERGDDRTNGRSSHGAGGGGRGSSCSPASSPTRHPNAVSPVTSLNHSMMQQMQQQHNQLSPPPHMGGVPSANGLPAGLPPRMPHGLPPHSLGLLNSLQMMHHASPLELMAAAHHHVPPRTYNSPPPISTSDPSANECKLVEYRGQKVAAFIISGETMLCLPQAFELFLKHLVGGLHTVYTKLKRLDIVPLVCNVEQVRILRGLGAIQPGVNRCKLLCCKDFDILYRDCTTARCLSIKPPESSRPGRPPKRGPVGLSLPPTHLSQHPQLKKHRLDNGEYPYENGHISDMKSPLLANGYNPPPINHMAFMQMNHHPGSALMSPGMPPHGLHARPDSQMLKAAAQSGMSAANMDALARSGIWENCRAAYEDIVKHLERLREERTDERQQMGGGSNAAGAIGSIEPKPRDLSSRNCSPNRQSPVLNLSKSGGNTDQGSNCDERSERSDIHSPAHSVRDDSVERTSGRSGAGGDMSGGNGRNIDDEDIENMSDDNVSDIDDRMVKDVEDLSDVERDNISPSSTQRHHPHSLTHNASSMTSSADRVAGSVSLTDRDGSHSVLQHGSPSQNAAAVAVLQHQRALNYSQLAAAAAAANGAVNGPTGVVPGSGNGGALTPNEALQLAATDATTAAAALAAGAINLGPLAMDPGLPSSTETLLRNIQSLLKVAADNARQQERQITYEKAELKMDVLREREVKDSLERQLVDERKLRVLYQKRYRRERKLRIRYQQQMEGGKRKSPNASSSSGGGNSGGNNNNANGNGNNNSSSNNASSNNNNNNNSSSASANVGSINDEVRSIDSASMHSKHSGSITDLTRKSDQDQDGKQSEKSDKSSISSLNSHNTNNNNNNNTNTNNNLHLSAAENSSDNRLHLQQQPAHSLRPHSESPSFKREPQSDHESRSAEDLPSSQPQLHHLHPSDSDRHSSSDRLNERDDHDERRSSDRDSNRPPSSHAAENSLAVAAAAAAAAAANGKGQWTYPGIDLMATGAFWQNYSESLAQEIELERKTRSAGGERDVKSPLAERQAAAAYYKNSVLFGSAN
ncbi:dachshund family transcription factor isoform X2 [Haematobia irritans]|uniref:dachshund family transcription factor isoform X2 n=1 Tax=Haematobia irritans TaxID=7368 RepID=UPI003F50C385